MRSIEELIEWTQRQPIGNKGSAKEELLGEVVAVLQDYKRLAEVTSGLSAKQIDEIAKYFCLRFTDAHISEAAERGDRAITNAWVRDVRRAYEKWIEGAEKLAPVGILKLCVDEAKRLVLIPVEKLLRESKGPLVPLDAALAAPPQEGKTE